MKISVDTSQDSHDEIRKVIAMLRHFVGDSDIPSTAPEQSEEVSQESASAFSSMFGDEPTQPETTDNSQPEEVDTQPTSDGSSNVLFNDLFQGSEEKKEDDDHGTDHKVELY